MSKIVERLALVKLQPHLLNSPQFCQMQSAYRAGHSTETALLKVTDDIYRSLDNGSFVASVSLDISAAFDSIDHDILIDRLSSEFNVRDTALAWIRSYNTNRYSFAKVGQVISARSLCSSGVAQCSVLRDCCSRFTFLRSVVSSTAMLMCDTTNTPTTRRYILN